MEVLAWRDLKVREMKLACAVLSNQLDEAEAVRFIADYGSASVEDKANPDEIVAGAKLVRDRSSSSVVVDRILDWSRTLGYQD